MSIERVHSQLSYSSVPSLQLWCPGPGLRASSRGSVQGFSVSTGLCDHHHNRVQNIPSSPINPIPISTHSCPPPHPGSNLNLSLWIRLSHTFHEMKHTGFALASSFFHSHSCLLFIRICVFFSFAFVSSFIRVFEARRCFLPFCG